MNRAVLKHLRPEHVEVELCRADELAQRRGLTSELDEMWSYVGKKAEPRWLWHAIDHYSGTVLAYVFGRRKDTVFGSVSKVEMATPIDLIYKVLLPSISTFETPPASLWISMPPSHRLPSRLIPASGARPRGARPRERD